MSRNAILSLIVIVAVAGLVWSALQGVDNVECEICVTFQGETVCRTGQGRDRDAAIYSAQTAACAVLAIGREETIKCGNVQPTSVSCD